MRLFPKIRLDDEELIEEMEHLEDAVRESTPTARKNLWRGFFYGLASGIGALVAAAVVIPLVIYLMGKIHWVPLIGDFADQVSEYMQTRDE